MYIHAHTLVVLKSRWKRQPYFYSVVHYFDAIFFIMKIIESKAQSFLGLWRLLEWFLEILGRVRML